MPIECDFFKCKEKAKRKKKGKKKERKRTYVLSNNVLAN